MTKTNSAALKFRDQKIPGDKFKGKRKNTNRGIGIPVYTPKEPTLWSKIKLFFKKFIR